jgi:hypothetical protein
VRGRINLSAHWHAAIAARLQAAAQFASISGFVFRKFVSKLSRVRSPPGRAIARAPAARIRPAHSPFPRGARRPPSCLSPPGLSPPRIAVPATAAEPPCGAHAGLPQILWSNAVDAAPAPLVGRRCGACVAQGRRRRTKPRFAAPGQRQPQRSHRRPGRGAGPSARGRTGRKSALFRHLRCFPHKHTTFCDGSPKAHNGWVAPLDVHARFTLGSRHRDFVSGVGRHGAPSEPLLTSPRTRPATGERAVVYLQARCDVRLSAPRRHDIS